MTVNEKEFELHISSDINVNACMKDDLPVFPQQLKKLINLNINS